jgi:hypothetical protein
MLTLAADVSRDAFDSKKKETGRIINPVTEI